MLDQEYEIMNIGLIKTMSERKYHSNGDIV